MPLPQENRATSNNLLQAEIDWIMAHPARYEGPMHQRAVIGNLRKRYAATALERQVRQWAAHPTTGNAFAVLAEFGISEFGAR